MSAPASSSTVPPPVAAAGDAGVEAFRRLQRLEHDFQLLAAAHQQATAVHSTPRTTLPKAPPMVAFTGQVGVNGFEVDVWLREVHKQFTHYGTTVFPDHATRINYAVQWLNGAALDWWESEVKSADACEKWEEFEKRIRDRYRPQMPAEIARQRLRQLQQKGHVSAYCNLFLQLVSRIPDKSESDKIFEFKQGLDRAFAVKVAEAKPKTLQEAIEVAVQAAPYINTSSKGAFHYQGRSSSNSYAHVGGRAVSSANSSVPMDINAIGVSAEDADVDRHQPAAESDPNVAMMQAMLHKMEAMEHRLHAISQPSARAKNNSNRSNTRDRVPGLSGSEIAKLMAEGRCFRCKKTGHMKSECPESAAASGPRLKY